MIIANKADFFAVVPTLRESEIVIPGTDKKVRLREMTVGRRIEYERLAKDKSEGEMATLLLISSAVDMDGNPLFSHEDVDALNSLSLNIFPPFMKALEELNSLSVEAVEDGEKK
ncbi:MAG: hypothetical protein BGO49_24905 [Planctomycetales bacterium 71-10]|nr:MAG: hypothetical protein BGO49_24905 [Planctomycetales bacterium 71-10]